MIILFPDSGVCVVPRRDVRGVAPEWPGFGPEMPAGVKGNVEYRAHFNPQSAVSAVLMDGRKLGLKPGEFDFVCPFMEKMGPAETVLPSKTERDLDYPWRVFGEGMKLEIDGKPHRVVRVAVGVRGWRLDLEEAP